MQSIVEKQLFNNVLSESSLAASSSQLKIRFQVPFALRTAYHIITCVSSPSCNNGVIIGGCGLDEEKRAE